MIRLHEETRRQAALKKLAEYDRKHQKPAVQRQFYGSSENKQEKARGCLAFPSQDTADGNADRARACGAFKDGNKNGNLGVA